MIQRIALLFPMFASYLTFFSIVVSDVFGLFTALVTLDAGILPCPELDF